MPTRPPPSVDEPEAAAVVPEASQPATLPGGAAAGGAIAGGVGAASGGASPGTGAASGGAGSGVPAQGSAGISYMSKFDRFPALLEAARNQLAQAVMNAAGRTERGIPEEVAIAWSDAEAFIRLAEEAFAADIRPCTPEALEQARDMVERAARQIPGLPEAARAATSGSAPGAGSEAVLQRLIALSAKAAPTPPTGAASGGATAPGAASGGAPWDVFFQPPEPEPPRRGSRAAAEEALAWPNRSRGRAYLQDHAPR